ncbi:hypothetical protein BJX76DRAFT_329875 [Aspergillus varians]
MQTITFNSSNPSIQLFQPQHKNTMSTIFICGATGTQGGSIIANLPGTNLKAHAVARDPSSPASEGLKKTSLVTLFQGDFNDKESLRTAMQGCSALFLNLKPLLTDIPQELEQAERIMSVAKEVGINHIVYSSGLIQQAEHNPYWDPDSFVASIVRSKKAVEAAVRNAGFKNYTILRPGNFMTNYLAPYIYPMYPGLAEKGEYTTAFLPETVIPMVDPNDIGRFGVAAFEDPARFDNKEISIASELIVLGDIMRSLTKATGSEKKVNYMSHEEIDSQKKTNPFLASQLVMRDMAKLVDMDEVRSWGISLGTFDEFLQREKGRVVKTYVQQ